ncbi:MAG: coniferyl aldehyde dehydrogenase [Lysobacterales bacterium]
MNTLSPTTAATIAPTVVDLRAVFSAQRTAYEADRFPSAPVRIDRLRRLEALLHANQAELGQAIATDFGQRPLAETRLLEIFPSLEAVRHARSQVRRWMRPERRATSLWFLPGRSEVVAQPLGVIGIMVPWNYPILLAVSPLAAAMAAGNRAMVKVSELTPNTSALFLKLVGEHFASDEVQVIAGDTDVARAFAGLPFDHLLFTGSTRVGHHIMRAAAENLTPVTLELGGKSPAMVAPGYSLARAADRIMVGKLMNAGQTCIAPDYVLVPHAQVDAFVQACVVEVGRLYPGIDTSPDYATVVNRAHFERLTGYLDEARAAGAKIIPLTDATANPDTRRLPPIAITGAPDSCALMRDEIFGPLLPIVGYANFDEALDYVNARPRPLAMYLFDRDERRITRALREIVAGGVTVNDTILHIAQENLPFGGVGASGMGHYHGHDGFNTFSQRKGVFRQSRLNAMGWFKPPYGARFRRLVDLLIR